MNFGKQENVSCNSKYCILEVQETAVEKRRAHKFERGPFKSIKG
jgi:hypothetical protein